MADPRSFYKSATIDPNNKVMVFNRIFDVFSFNDEVAPNLTGMARTMYDKTVNDAANNVSDISWFGTRDIASVTGTLGQYLFSNELNNFIQTTLSSTVRVDIRDISQKRKITFTERDIGVFSFDLASLGLVRVYEYYSPLLKKIVQPNLVRSIKYPDGRLVFYHVAITGVPRHEVFWSTKDGAYVSKLLNGKVKGDLVTNDGDKFYHVEVASVSEHEVERREKIGSNGKPEFTSTWKKSFIYIPKIDKKIPRIDLIINSAYSGSVNAQREMIYGSMAGIAIAMKLQESGIKFRIFSSIADSLNNGRNMYRFIKLKDENEPVNANGLAVILSDGRFYRYADFKNICTSAFELGWGDSIRSGYSGPINDATRIKNMFVSYLRATKDFDSGSEIVEEAKIVIPTVLSQAAADRLYNQTVAQISNITTP